MELPGLKHDYYDALVRQALLGPRRELNLSLELRNDGRRGEGLRVAIRFGGIANFEEVREFFRGFDLWTSRWCGLHFLRYSHERPSKPGDLLIEMQFDSTGNELCIACRNVAVSD